MPIIVTILRVVAILLLLLFLYQAIVSLVDVIKGWSGGTGQFGQPMPPVSGFGQRLSSLIGPLFTLVQGVLFASLIWGFGDLLAMIRDLVVGRPLPAPAADGE